MPNKHIKNHEIHVWVEHFDPTAKLTVAMQPLLSEAEAIRAEAFHRSEDQSRYVQAHAMLRRLLGDYTGTNPRQLKFSKGAHGKPYLEGPRAIQFNMSHTTDLIAVAICQDRRIGLDIETYAHMGHLRQVAELIMAKREWRAFRSLDHHQQLAYFFRCWVRKESLVKALGTGIGDTLNEIHVMNDQSIEAGNPLAVRIEGKSEFWHVVDISLGRDHMGAVCIESGNAETWADISIIRSKTHCGELVD